MVPFSNILAALPLVPWVDALTERASLTQGCSVLAA